MSTIKRTIIISAETKSAQQAVDDLTEQLQIQDKVILKLTEDQAFYEAKLASASKSNFAEQKFYNDKLKETNSELTKEIKARRTLDKEHKKANVNLKSSAKEQKKLTGTMALMDKFTGGAITGMMNLYKGIVVAARGTSILKAALISTGVGALVVAVASLVAMFSQSEKGQEAMEVLMMSLSAITNEFMDQLANLGELIVRVFKEPKQIIKELGEAFEKNMQNRVEFFMESLGHLGDMMKKVFDGDFKGAAESYKKSVKTMVDSTIGMEDGLKTLKDLYFAPLDNAAKEVIQMTVLTKARQRAHHIDRKLKVERAEADRKINNIRLQAEDREKHNASERIVLLRQAQAIEEEITAKEIESQRIKVKAQEHEMSLGKNTKEMKDKLADLQAQAIKLDTKKLRSQRLLQTQITTALNEEIADKKNADLELERLEEQHQLNLKLIQDFLVVSEEEKRQAERDALLLQYQKLYAIAWMAKEDTLELDAAYLEKTRIMEEGFTKEDADKKKQITDKEIADAEAVQNAKLGIASNTMALVGEIAGKGSKIGKAMAIGQATISGYQGVQNAFSTAQESPITATFPAYPFIQAGLAGAFAAVNIQKIASTKPSGSSGTGGLTSVASAGAQAPSFNIVGQGGANQIASAIGQQEQAPVQAFVVSQDITTAQSLENGIIQGATLGG